MDVASFLVSKTTAIILNRDPGILYLVRAARSNVRQVQRWFPALDLTKMFGWGIFCFSLQLNSQQLLYCSSWIIGDKYLAFSHRLPPNFVSTTIARSSFFLVPYTEGSIEVLDFCFEQDLASFSISLQYWVIYMNKTQQFLCNPTSILGHSGQHLFPRAWSQTQLTVTTGGPRDIPAFAFLFSQSILTCALELWGEPPNTRFWALRWSGSWLMAVKGVVGLSPVSEKI